MALVLNTTKDFNAEKMNADSGGNVTNNQFSQDSHFDRGPASYRCNFCPGSFPSLYHLQCHNVYKHSSILGSHGNETKQDGHQESAMKSTAFHPLPGNGRDVNFRMNGTVQDMNSGTVHNDQKPGNSSQKFDNMNISCAFESGALDLSTVKCRKNVEPENLVTSTVPSLIEPKPAKMSSSHSDEETDSDNDESDKLVIDTQSEATQENEHEKEADVSCDSPPLKNSSENFKHNNEIVSNECQQNTQLYPPVQHELRPSNAPHRGYYQNLPSNENHHLDMRSRSPLKVNDHSKQEVPVDRLNFPPFYNPHTDTKFPAMENQSLLNMIPPIPNMGNMGMMGNFPMPFGFSPFMPMMYPPNSFMPQANITNTQDVRFPLQADTFPSNMVQNLPFSPNLSLQPSKVGPMRKTEGGKPRTSSKRDGKKSKEVVEIYQCKACSRQFSQVGNFHNHMKTHESKACACGICSMEFSDSYELQRHMRNTHTGSMPYKCEQCDREFSQYNNLRRHLRVHNGKNYKCHLCGRTFNEVFYLEMHMGSHTGERTYKCGVCSATFSDNAELQKHVGTHSAEELHTCDVCGKSFSKACVLRQHKKMHSGLRPFKCEVCDKSFIHRHHLTIHSRMHNSNKPYVCKICKKEFAQTSHLYKHIRQHTEQPGVTEAMIHESLAPILKKLKQDGGNEDASLIQKLAQNDNTLLSNDTNNPEDTSVKNADDIKSDYKSRENTQEKSKGDNSETDAQLNQNKSGNATSFKTMETELVSREENIDTAGNISKSDGKISLIGNIDNHSQKEAKLIATGMSITQIIHGSLKEMETLYRQQSDSCDDEKADEMSEKKENDDDFDDSCDNASDKTGVSVDPEQRFVSSSPSSIPYNEQCLEMPTLPRMPQYNHAEDSNQQRMDIKHYDEDKDLDVDCDSERYSPISQTNELLKDEEFRSRSNSETENAENVKQTPQAVSPRVISADSILKEQPIPGDNCPSGTLKSDLVMPLKKRRRYTPRQKKKSHDEIEQEENVKKSSYPQMIQPMPAEAQQMYFLQLQQMQMALAANVMAAQGAMMQNVTGQMKSRQINDHQGVPNEIPYSHSQKQFNDPSTYP